MGKITPGERANHWAKALVTVWPIILVLAGGTVYGNSEKVRGWIHGPEVKTPPGQIDKVDDKPLTLDQIQTRSINQLIDKNVLIEAQLKKLSARSNVKDGSLQRQITKWHGDG